MAAAIRGYNTAAQGQSKAKARLAALAAGVGITDLFLKTVWIDDSTADRDTSIRKYLMDLLGRDLSLSISIGPKRAVQKPVLQVLDRSGHPLAFAKVGQNALTRDLVEREARNLGEIGPRLRSSHQVVVPTILSTEVWRGSRVLVQSALRSGHAPGRDQFLSAMHAIACLDEEMQERNFDTSPYWHRLRDRIHLLPETTASRALRSAAATLHDHARTVVLPFGAWHGDLTPWNITADTSEVRVWDWEHYSTGVPVGFDVVHYDIHSRLSRGSTSVVDTICSTLDDAPSSLTPLGVSASAAAWIALLYVMEIATRYVEDREEDGDTTLGGLTWLDPVLRRRLPDVQGASW